MFNKIIKEITWNEIKKVEKCGRMRNAALRIVLFNGDYVYLDDRQKICSAIEAYGKIYIKLADMFNDDIY